MAMYTIMPTRENVLPFNYNIKNTTYEKQKY